jgi:AcrR family transcriptional regulator
MSLKDEAVGPQRRRGAALEEALLEAAWSELSEHGYDDVTFESVGTRAGTSRAVLYRRWSDKQQMVRAALLHAVTKDVVTAPDTGSLRGDVIALLKQANRQRVRLAIQLVTRLGDYYRDTGSSLAELGATVEGGRKPFLHAAIRRAIDRGELPPVGIPERVARVPIDLFRHEVLITLRPVSDDTIVEIVDMIFLPLVRRNGPAGADLR